MIDRDQPVPQTVSEEVPCDLSLCCIYSLPDTLFSGATARHNAVSLVSVFHTKGLFRFRLLACSTVPTFPTESHTPALLPDRHGFEGFTFPVRKLGVGIGLAATLELAARPNERYSSCR